MDYFSNSEIDYIAEDCIKHYHSLPKTGKPVDQEWTVLSCVIQYEKTLRKHKVVSLGTGSKCIGASKMSPLGNNLNDSHAEILARRGFLLYLYENILNALDNKTSILIRESNKFKLKDNIDFLFYSSQMPCGDASIIPKCGEQDDFGYPLVSSKRAANSDECDIENKKIKLDVHRTGAKCLSNTDQDPKMPGEKYHLIGQVRTKPGRGDRTLSVSCSDKMARWIHLGFEGALLSLLLCEPIYIKSFLFGSGVPYSTATLNRSLLYRENKIDLKDRVQTIPEFYQSSIVFPHIRTSSNFRPAAGSIIWANTSSGLQEVAVQGMKLGLTKKKADNLCNCLSVCKYSLYKKFIDILSKSNDLKNSICGEESLTDIPYNRMKKKNHKYHKKWSLVKETFFKTWTIKPDIWNFCIDNRVISPVRVHRPVRVHSTDLLLNRLENKYTNTLIKSNVISINTSMYRKHTYIDKKFLRAILPI